MSEYRDLFTRQLKYTLYLLALLVLGWGFTPYKAVFLGLILGSVFSFYNFWSMYRKINRLGEAVLNKKKVRSLGSLQRLAVSGLAVMIAMRYPETFHLISVVVGLMTYYIVIMIDFYFQTMTGKQA